MVDLVPIAAEPLGGSIVERLEEVLEVAREGKLSSVCVAVVYRDGSVSHSSSDLPNRVLMIGALDRARHKINRDLDD